MHSVSSRRDLLPARCVRLEGTVDGHAPVNVRAMLAVAVAVAVAGDIVSV